MLARRILTSLLFHSVIALWVWHDARRRGARKPPFAAAMALLFGPLGVAFYVADRPLLAGEERHGGFAWQMARAFIAAWTAFVPCILLLGWRGGPIAVIEPGFGVVQFSSLGLTIALGLWLVPVVVAWVVGRTMRRPAERQVGAVPRGSGVSFAAGVIAAAIVGMASTLW